MPTKTKTDIIADLQRRVAMLEETVLAAATVLWPEEDWGPEPPNAGRSYRAYLSENIYEEASDIRVAWKARGWRHA